MQEDMNKELTHSIQERDETIQGAPYARIRIHG